MELKEAFNTIQMVHTKNLHLNIYRQNNEVLAQLYNVSDFNSWDLGIGFPNKNGAVLELTFSLDKTSNSQNFDKFKNSKYWNDFKTSEKINEDSYFKLLSGNKIFYDSFKELNLILKSVYGSLKNNHFELVSY